MGQASPCCGPSPAPLASSCLGHTSSCLGFLKTQPIPKVGHQGWANGQHTVDLGERPALSLSYTSWNANLLTGFLLEPGWGPSGWGSELQGVREMTLSQSLEQGMAGGTTVGWGAGVWDPRVKATRKPVQAPGPRLGEAQPSVFLALRGSGRGGVCVPHGAASLKSAASEHSVKEPSCPLPQPHPLPQRIPTLGAREDSHQ